MIGLLAFHSLAITLGDSLDLGYYSPLYRPHMSMQKLLSYIYYDHAACHPHLFRLDNTMAISKLAGKIIHLQLDGKFSYNA